jgi:O-antigen ligase
MERGGSPVSAETQRPVSTGADIPVVVTALAVYVFVLISRVADDLPALHLGLLAPAIVAVLGLFRSDSNQRHLLSLPEARALLALFVLSIVTTPLSVWPGRSFTFVTQEYVVLVFLFFTTILCVASERAVRLLLGAVLVAMAVVAIRLVLWGSGARPMVTGTYDSNDIAFIMVCGFPLAFNWFLSGSGIRRYVAGICSALAVITIVRTGSRGGLVALCVILCLVLITATPRRRLRPALAILLVCVTALGMYGSTEYWNRMKTIWGAGDYSDAALSDYDASGVWAARWPVWQSALQLILDNPLKGVGPGAFDIAEGLSHAGVGKWSTAHNSFLQIAGELGLAGLALFIFFLCRGIRNCRHVVRLAKQRPELTTVASIARSVELSLYGFVVAGFSLSQAYSSVPYILVAISAVLVRLAATHAEG